MSVRGTVHVHGCRTNAKHQYLPKRGHRLKPRQLPCLLSFTSPIPSGLHSLSRWSILLHPVVPAPRMATHHSPQSLPSFAQAFSPSSLNNIHSSNSLPPIQARPSFERFHRNDSPSSRHPSVEHNNASHSNGLKRSRDEGSSASNSASV